jgi:3-oxoacyl-[acyl-carrier protein] reductase
MALGLARAGIRVIATAAREYGEVEAVAREAPKGVVLPLLADVTQEDDAQRIVTAALDRFGRLDILVNNAGRGMRHVSEKFLTEPSRFWEVEPDTWRMIINTNVNNPFLMARAAAPHMARVKWGRIINVSVSHLTMRRQGFSPFGPSKAALESETIIWAQDLRGTGVTVNALLPGGATLTGMVPDSVSRKAKAEMFDPTIMVPPLLWLVSEDSDTISASRCLLLRYVLNESRSSRDAFREGTFEGRSESGARARSRKPLPGGSGSPVDRHYDRSPRRAVDL